ncbi:MAG: hypothetical protein LBG59_08865 [Candidatus Peribacteria bacterium]|nr:hypothetical protein [Candidatus Peribacteria bacterium]
MKWSILVLCLCINVFLVGCDTSFTSHPSTSSLLLPILETGDNTLRKQPLQHFIETIYSGEFLCDRNLENYLFYNFIKIPYKNEQFILNLLISCYERTPLDNVNLCEGQHNVLIITEKEGEIHLMQSFNGDIPEDIQEIIETYTIEDTRYQRALEMFSVSRKEYGKCSEEICNLIDKELYFLYQDNVNPLYTYYSPFTSGGKETEILILGSNHRFFLQDNDSISHEGYRQFVNQDTIGYRLPSQPEIIQRKELQYINASTVSFYTLYPNDNKF